MKRWLCGAAALLLAEQAQALCSVPVGTNLAGFGDVNSTLVRGAIQPTSGNAGLSCTGSLLSLLASNDRFLATITSADNATGLVGPTGDVIPYTLYANNTISYPITRGVAFDFARNGIIDLLGLLNGSTPKSVPIYLKTVIGSNVAAGLYKEKLSIFWYWNYCSGIGLGNICLGRDESSGTATLEVSLRVTNDCQITTPNISFGSAPVVSGFATVSQSVNLSCTKGTLYTVGMGDGLYPSGNRRRMMSAASNYLAYDIFKSAGTQRWGSLSGARRSSSEADVNPGPGTGTGSQIFNYNAKIYTDQATPPATTYSDSVILDVQF